MKNRTESVGYGWSRSKLRTIIPGVVLKERGRLWTTRVLSSIQETDEGVCIPSSVDTLACLSRMAKALLQRMRQGV